MLSGSYSNHWSNFENSDDKNYCDLLFVADRDDGDDDDFGGYCGDADHDGVDIGRLVDVDDCYVNLDDGDSNDKNSTMNSMVRTIDWNSRKNSSNVDADEQYLNRHDNVDNDDDHPRIDIRICNDMILLVD